MLFHIVKFMAYLAFWNHQLHISAFEKANVDSVYKHLRKKTKNKQPLIMTLHTT